MRQAATVIAGTVLWLLVLDLGVAVFLASNLPGSGGLGRYFDLGRSVPGKLAAWQAAPERADNLLGVGWLDDVTRNSATAFAAEPADGPVLRGYGMSFTNRILAAASEARPGLIVDHHGGPGIPPNWSYAAFLDDRANRRPGDVAVWGVLSSAVPAMFSMSNRTWVFEQPAPLTYPVFTRDGEGLRRRDPLVRGWDEETLLDPVRARDWAAQLRGEDALWTSAAFRAPWTDASPFLRLVRRSLATGAIDAREAKLLATRDWAGTLAAMARGFARIARADGQLPIVVLVETRAGTGPDLLAALGSALEAEGIAYFATARHVDPRDPANFLSDGHYTGAVDAAFGRAFLALPEIAAALQGP